MSAFWGTADVLSYFRASPQAERPTGVITEEHRVGDGGFSFARRMTDGPDVLPVAASQKPSLRRKHEAARRMKESAKD
jgi:hypothetical protein